MEGARERYGSPLPPEVVERLDYELGVIGNMGFAAYFLVVWDLIRFARESGIRVGPGRGSAAGCCVAYCLRIVDLDPIRYDLLFERFLNPGRKQMPDIDMDFDERYRARRHALRGGEVRERPGGPGHHVLDHQGPGGRARRRPGAGQAVRGGRPHRQGHAAPGHGARHAVAGLPHQDRGARGRLRGRRRAADHARDRPRRQGGHRRRARPRGPAPPGRDPRGRGGHLPRPVDGLPAHPAQAGRGRGPRGRADRHPVRNARRRGPRSAEDGLPRPAQPLGDRAQPRSDRGGHRRAARHRQRRPRRRADARDAAAGRVGRGVPARGRRHAPDAALPGTDELRRRRGPRRPLPPGSDGRQHAPRLPRAEERPEGTDVPAPGHRADPQGHLRADAVPGVGDAGGPEVRRVLARGGGQPPQGVREEDPGHDRRGAREVRRRVRRTGLRRGARHRSSSTSSSRSPTTPSTSRTPTATAWWPTRRPG